MPHGKLFFKTASTNGWVDAYDTYGMSLEDGALSKIITPAPHKAPVTSSGVTSHGRAMLGSSIGKKDGRTMSFDVHFTGATEAQFLTRYYAFCQQVLDAGYVKMYVVLPGGDPFPKFNNAHGAMHLIYQDCQPFQQYQMGLAKFTLVFEEPHPEIIKDAEPPITQ